MAELTHTTNLQKEGGKGRGVNNYWLFVEFLESLYSKDLFAFACFAFRLGGKTIGLTTAVSNLGTLICICIVKPTLKCCGTRFIRYLVVAAGILVGITWLTGIQTCTSYGCYHHYVYPVCWLVFVFTTNIAVFWAPLPVLRYIFSDVRGQMSDVRRSSLVFFADI